MSFRPKGEILLRSLAFARDDRPCPSLGVLCVLPRVNSRIRVLQLNEKFAQAAEILKDSSSEFAEGFFKIIFSVDFFRALSAWAVSYTVA